MATDLALHIAATPLSDTHEHMRKEADYVNSPFDIVMALFDNYVQTDLITAGASGAALAALRDVGNPDLRGRFNGIRAAWEAAQYTGYGEAVRLIAREVYGMDEISGAALEAAQPVHDKLHKPGERLRLLRDQAKLDHIQTDDFCWPCQADASGPDFFFYDLSWWSFCNGVPDLAALAQETSVTVDSLDTLRAGMRGLFTKYAGAAIAIKSQHAYERTLEWCPRTDAEAAAALRNYLSAGTALSEADKICLGDWCLARGVELGIEFDLPFKLHTGTLAGAGRFPINRIRAGHLWELLAAFPQARFVLMHTAYPYTDELVALLKNSPNAYVDLCWAWAIDPYTTRDFVRRFLHAVPANKLFVFGGDTFWPGTALAYAIQARRWLTRTLQAEVEEELLSEPEAIALATRLMMTNQQVCFNVPAKKRAARETSAAGAT
jgi:uncharacterized protein